MVAVDERATLAGTAYAVVRRRMLRGELPPGHTISRRQLAAELGMSFLPVSEALLRLELEGLLESRPRAGTRVRIPSRADVEGHFVVREALEMQAARLFVVAATPRDHLDLRELAAHVDAASTQDDRARYLDLHLTLHRRIAECTRCPSLSSAIERSHALGTIWFCTVRDASSAGSPTRHRDLVDALCGGDQEAAAAAVRRHIERAKAHALEILAPFFMPRGRGTPFTRRQRRDAPAAGGF